LRAVAVIAVILFHLDLAWAAGGFLGVDVFFVISGYPSPPSSGPARSTAGSIWPASGRPGPDASCPPSCLRRSTLCLRARPPCL